MSTPRGGDRPRATAADAAAAADDVAAAAADDVAAVAADDVAAVAADYELVARALAGDHGAYGDLVLRHQATIYRHIRGMGLDHDTSCDIVQDGFVRGYTRLADCREPAHFRAWLFRITRNLCLDHLKNVRQRSVSLSALADADQIPDPTAAAADREDELRDALDGLPLALREAFLLKHDAGYTYDEIAEITGSGVSAVKMRVHRARETLRARLTSQDVHCCAGDDRGAANRPACERAG